MVILRDGTETVQRMLTVLEEETKEYEMKINVDKIKIIEITGSRI